MDDASSRNWQTHPGKPGVIYRVHSTRKHGRKLDCFWAIRHRVNGKRLVETLGWSTEGWTADMAQNLLHELQRNVKLGVRPQTLAEKREMDVAAKAEAQQRATLESLQDITFGELAALYQAWAKIHRRDAVAIEGRLRLHILPEIGSLPARSITVATIKALRDQLEAKRPQRGLGMNNPDARLSGQMVSHCLQTIREIFNFALETPHPTIPDVMLYTGKNPAVLSRRGHGVRPPKHDARRLRILTDFEIEALLQYHGSHIEDVFELRFMMLLSLDTGLRAGELVRLRIEDIEVTSGAVRVCSGSDSGLTKGGRTRIVHAGQLFPEALRQLRRRVRARTLLNRRKLLTPYLFPAKDGGLRNATALGRAMNRIADKLRFNANVTDARNRVVWHTLRHTYATRMLESGVDIYTLKELMGHASVTTTEGYLHLIDRAKRERALARLRLNAE